MRKSTLGWLVLLGAIGMIGAGLAVRADAQELAPGRFGGQMGALRHYAAHWEAGLSFADVAGVVAIDGAAYDVPVQMKDGPPIMRGRYREAFGEDAARQQALSPTLQAAAPNAARFLLLHVQRPDGVRQSAALAKALAAGGAAVEVDSFPGQGLLGHIEINRRLGESGYDATAKVDDWLKRVFAG